MNITCTKENLLEGLTRVSHVAGKNTTLPILSNVLVKTEGGGITLITTNLETGMRATVRGKVEGKGEITVPAGILTEYVSLLPNGVVKLETEGDVLNVQMKSRTTKVKGMSADEFPVLPEVEKGVEVAVDGALLKQAIAQVGFAVAGDTARPEISGVYMHFSGDTCTLVATDSYRLSERVVPLTETLKEDTSIIVPVRTLQELTRVLQDDAVKIITSESQIRFMMREVEIVSRLIEGRYPDYQQIIPTESSTTIEIGVEEFLQAVRSVSIFCKSGINDVSLTVQAEKNQLVVQATNTQIGESTAVLNVKRVSGTDLTIVFNYRYLMDGLQAFGEPAVQLKLLDQGNPGILAPKEGDYFLYLLMPIKQ